MVNKLQQADRSAPIKDFLVPAETAVRADLTLEQARQQLQQRTINSKIFYFYAIDADEKLVGVASTRKIILSNPEQKISDIMEPRIIAIQEDATLGDALTMFHANRLLALPVIDADGKLKGIVDVEIYADEALDLAETARLNDMFQMMGVSLETLQGASRWSAFRDRMPWLMCNIFSGVICAIIGAVFQQTLAATLVLAMFIPLVLTLSESMAMQSMAMTLQYLHHLRASAGNFRMILLGELRILPVLGITCAAIAATITAFWGGEILTVKVMAISILASMLAAGAIGVTMPALLFKLKLNPHIAAGPMSLMITDILTTAIYLGTAAAIIGAK